MAEKRCGSMSDEPVNHHKIATEVIDAHLDWGADRTLLLRDLTKAIEVAYDAGLLAGVDQGREEAYADVADELWRSEGMRAAIQSIAEGSS